MYAQREEWMPRTADRVLGPRVSTGLPGAIRRTLAYAELFRYPLTAHELHRYLHGYRASVGQVRATLAAGLAGVEANDGYYAPAGQPDLAIQRRSLLLASAALSRRARFYALLLKHLPYVRMVGLTGSLAMRNSRGRSDIDLMIVTAPARVWLCRAAVVAVVRVVGLAGDVLCPNYLVSEDALALEGDSIYDAHELAQMLPFYGRETYHRLWSGNPQLQALLPNATPRRMPPDRLLPGLGALKALAERALRGPIGDRMERWERERKSARLRRRCGDDGESILSPQQCKGHFGAHRTRILTEYARATAERGAVRDLANRPGHRVPGTGSPVPSGWRGVYGYPLPTSSLPTSGSEH